MINNNIYEELYIHNFDFYCDIRITLSEYCDCSCDLLFQKEIQRLFNNGRTPFPQMVLHSTNFDNTPFDDWDFFLN